VPILLGLMPLQDLRHAEYLQNEVPEMSVPSHVLERMWQAGERGPAVGRDVGCELLHEARRRGLVHGLLLSSASGSATDMAGLLPRLLA